ncbi:MAG: hypothetical protein Fur0037_00690 [Planctomycetota bacterium]
MTEERRTGARPRTSGEPLRVVLVMPFFAWRYGGSVEQARLTSLELRRRGHSVAILTTDLGCEDGRDAAEEGLEVRRFPARGLGARPPYPPPAGLLAELDRELDRASVVTTQVGLTLLNRDAERRARGRGVPFVYCAQGALSPERLRQKGVAKMLFLALVEQPLLRRASAIQALSEREAQDLMRQGAPAERIAIVPNGIDAAEWGRGDARAARARLSLGERRVILFLGRLAPEKGLDIALEAAAPLLRSTADLCFVFAGPDGGMERTLRAMARAMDVSDRVLFSGPVPPDGRADLLAAASVFAHPSRAEGQPLSVLEAAAAGCPLWITEGCNLPDVARCGAGTVDPLDADALRRSLERLLDESGRERFAASARSMVEERFSVRATVDRLVDLYRSLRRP